MPRELQPIIDRLELSLSRLTQAADSLADRLEGVDPSAPGRTVGPSLGAGGVTLGGGGLPVGSSGAVKVEIDESSSGRFLGPAAGSVLGATISPVAPFLALGAIIQSGLGDDIADLGIRFGGSVTRALIQRGDEIGQAIVTGLIRELSTVTPGVISAIDREANVSGVVRGANETLGTFTGFPYPTLQNRIFGRQIFGEAPTSSSAAPGIFQQTGAAALTVANRLFDRGSVLDALPDNLPANVNQFIDPRAYYRRIRGGIEGLFGPQEQPQVIPTSTPPGPQGTDPLNVTRNFGGPFNPQTYGDPFGASRNFAGAQYDPTAFGVIGEFAAASAVDSAAFAFGGPVGLGLSIGTQTFFGGASVANAELPPAAELIRRHEGFRSQPYYDPAGLPTRGYGELLSSTPGADLSQFSAVSESEANQQLAQRIQELERQIDQLVQVPINQNQRAALTSFAYNVGTNAFADSTLLRELNAGDYEGAAAQFPSWVFAGGQRLPGLERRRAEEAELFRTPVRSEGGFFGNAIERISNFITPEAGAVTVPSRFFNPQNFPITNSREAFQRFARRINENDPDLVTERLVTLRRHNQFLEEQTGGYSLYDEILEDPETLSAIARYQDFGIDDVGGSQRALLRRVIREAPELDEDINLYRGIRGIISPGRLESGTPLHRFSDNRAGIPTSFSLSPQQSFVFTGGEPFDAFLNNSRDIESTFFELFVPRYTPGAGFVPDSVGFEEFEVLLNSLAELNIVNRFQAGPFDVMSLVPNTDYLSPGVRAGLGIGAAGAAAARGLFGGTPEAQALAPPPSDPQSALVNQLQALPEAAQNLIPPELQSRIADLVAIGPQPAVNAGARRVSRFSPGTLANTFTDLRRTGALLGGVGEAFPQASPLTEPTVEYLEQVQSSLGEAIGELPFGERIREQALIAEDAIEGLAESSDLFGRSVAEALTGAVRQTDGWEDRLRRIPALLQDIIFELTIVRPATNIISDLFSSAFGNITNNVFGGGTQGNSSVAGESGVQITQNISDADPSRAYQYTDAALAAAESNRQRGANRVTSPYYNG